MTRGEATVESPLTASVPDGQKVAALMLLHMDERCLTCLHPAWAHARAADRLSGLPYCIGVDCRCRRLAR
jgi:hypothetical protein